MDPLRQTKIGLKTRIVRETGEGKQLLGRVMERALKNQGFMKSRFFYSFIKRAIDNGLTVSKLLEYH